MNGENELPEGWISIEIPEICEINPKKPSRDSIHSDTPVTFVPMPAVDADMGAITEPERRKFGDVRNGFTFFQDGDVIFAKITPCMENGKAAIARNLINGLGFGSTEFFTLRSNGTVIPEYIYHFIRQESFRKAAEENMTGSVGQKRVPKHFIENSIIPLPPLAEQRRIVAAVEALLARVNASRERLDRVPGMLKAFRQAVLAAACSGRLTEEWREEHQDYPIIVGSNSQTGDFLIELPNTWQECKIQDIASPERNSITDGPFGSNLKTEHYTQSGPRVIRLQNIGNGEFIDIYTHISQEHFESLKKHRISKGDIVVAMLGDPIPRSCIIPDVIDLAIVKADCVRIKPNSDIINPQFLNYVLNEPKVRTQISEQIHGVARPRINLNQIRNYKIPLPPLAEQHEIVRRVELLFALVDRIEQRVVIGKERADRLTQAILANAFRGELVPTEAELASREGREYEPAGVLLERIRKERQSDGERKPRQRRIQSEKGG